MMIGGRYRLLRSIGRGGMGEVFLAQDEVLGREVAVKHILPGDEDQLTATQRLLREARSAARIHHPNVVTVHDLVVEDQDAYIVMEYVPAENLAQILRRGPISPERAGRIGAQVADALAAAHALGIVHRDVKPSNILVSPGDSAKLMDFGVARVAGDTGLTKTGHMIGSIAYMPPEIARGSEATPAADLYSLGATLYTAVEGHPPFAADDESSTSVAMLVRLVTESAPVPTRAGAITSVIASLLAADPSDRPTAAEAEEALRSELAAGSAVSLPATGSGATEDADEDEEALIETRVRPKISPEAPAPAEAAEDSLTRRRGVVEPAKSVVNYRVVAQGSPGGAEPKVPDLPATADVEPVPPVATTAEVASAPPSSEPRPAAAPKPKDRPLSPNQVRERRRRRAFAFGVPIILLFAIAPAVAIIGSGLQSDASAPPASESSGVPASTSLPTPMGSPTQASFSYKTYRTDVLEWTCVGDGLDSMTAGADGKNIAVTVYLTKALKSDAYLNIDVLLGNGDSYFVAVYRDHADQLYDLQKDKEMGTVDARADGQVIHALIPLSKLKPKEPVVVDADLETASDSASCGGTLLE